MEKYQKAIFQEIDTYMASTHVWKKQPKRSNQPADDFFHDFRDNSFKTLWLTVKCTPDHVRYAFYFSDGENEKYILQTGRCIELTTPHDIAREISFTAEAIHNTLAITTA